MALVGSVTGSVNLGGASTFISSSNGSSVEIGAATQVLILSGGGSTSLDPRNFADVNFFVSGTPNSQGTTTRGTALFGGDLYLSGAFLLNGSIRSNPVQYWYLQNTYPTNPIISFTGLQGNPYFSTEIRSSNIYLGYTSGRTRVGSQLQSPSAHLHITSSGGAVGYAPLKFDSGSLLATPEAGAVEFNGNNLFLTTGSTRRSFLLAGDVTGTFNDSNSRLVTTASVSFAGAQGAAYFASSSVGTDVFFFVSGTQQQKNTANGKTSVFGGDVVVSGVLHGGLSSFTSNTLLNLNGNNIVLYGGAVQQEATRSDISVFVSGSTGSKGGANKGTTVFGGDVVISGTIYDGSGTTYVAGGGGGGGGGDGAATYLVITATGSLLNERVITAGTNITMSDAGAGGAFTISSFPSGTFNDRSGGLVTTASISIAGAQGASYFASRSVGSSTGADVFFYVSGTARSAHSPAQGFLAKRALFNGDIVTSGTLQMLGAGYTSTIASDTLLFVSGGIGTKGTAFSRGTAVFAGDLLTSGNTHLGTVVESLTLTGSGLQGTLTFNTQGQSVFYVSGSSGNITANFTNVPSGSNSVISTNVILSQSAAGGFIVSAVQINSVASTILWANGVTPTANAGKHDVFGFSLIRSGTVWTTLGQMSTYG